MVLVAGLAGRWAQGADVVPGHLGARAHGRWTDIQVGRREDRLGRVHVYRVGQCRPDSSDHLVVLGVHRTVAMGDVGRPSGNGNRCCCELEGVVDHQVGPPLREQHRQIACARSGCDTEEVLGRERVLLRSRQPADHDVAGQARIGLAAVGPAATVTKPRLDAYDARSGPVVMTASCPARWAARTSGTIGSRCPYPGHALKRIFIRPTSSPSPRRSSSSLAQEPSPRRAHPQAVASNAHRQSVVEGPVIRVGGAHAAQRRASLVLHRADGTVWMAGWLDGWMACSGGAAAAVADPEWRNCVSPWPGAARWRVGPG